MADRDIEYTPVAEPVRLAITDESEELELIRLDAAARSLAADRAERDTLELDPAERRAARMAIDPNDPRHRSGEDQTAFFFAFWQYPTGCRAQAEQALPGYINGNGDLVEDYQHTVADAYATDEAVASGAQAWTDCMATAGYDFASPSSAQATFERRAFAASPDSETWPSDLELEDLLDETIANLEPIAAAEAEVRVDHERCVRDWLTARAAVRRTIADQFVARYG